MKRERMMADKKPNWKAEQLKIHIQVETLKVNKIKSELEIVDAEARIEAMHTNIDSSNKAIAEAVGKLDKLIEKHGNLIEGVT